MILEKLKNFHILIKLANCTLVWMMYEERMSIDMLIWRMLDLQMSAGEKYFNLNILKMTL